MKRILVTNDDGINAAGIRELIKALAPLGDVYVVAPDQQRSASGHSLNYRNDIRVTERKIPGTVEAYDLTGTPVDCVKYAIQMMQKKGLSIDYVISGINLGANYGSDVHYSGTCGAAREGALNGIHSIALSVWAHEATNFGYICNMIPKLMEISDELDPSTFLCVNTPDLPVWKIKGIKIVEAAPHNYGRTYTLKKQDNGAMRYSTDSWELQEEQDNDISWARKDYATISPITVDTNDRKALVKLQRMNYDNAFCVFVDYQTKLVPAMNKSKRLIKSVNKLARCLERMDIPMIITQQYSKGLGETVNELREAAGKNATYIEKTSFDAFGEPAFEKLMASATGNNVILAGIESHICVLMTARGFLDRGFKVTVVKDCCASRVKENHETAMQELADMGCKVTTWESVVYDLMQDSHHPAFKTVSSIVKED